MEGCIFSGDAVMRGLSLLLVVFLLASCASDEEARAARHQELLDLMRSDYPDRSLVGF